MDLSWEFYVTKPGSYKIQMLEFGGRDLLIQDFKSNSMEPHQLEIKVNGETIQIEAKGTSIRNHRFNEKQDDVISDCGSLVFKKGGLYKLEARIKKIAVRKVKLRRADQIGKKWEEKPRLVMNALKLVPEK